MVKLSGILAYSMGTFLCLRGFASLKELSRISKENPDVQRALIERHKTELSEFLNKGDYRFFSEVVLSVALETRGNYEEVDNFYDTIMQNKSWGNSKLGEYTISVFRHDSGDKNKIAQISFDENIVTLNRVDGNHRLSAADKVTEDFKIPFCLILCRTKDEEAKYSTAIFHNINAKQIPLKLEENYKVIIERSAVFSDEILKNDPTFGLNYYFARKTLQNLDFSYFPSIDSYIRQSKFSFFVDLYDLLLKNCSIEENDSAIETIKSKLFEVENALIESEITATTTNIAVIGTLAYYKLTNEFKYRGFLSWIKKNNIGNVEELHMNDVINLYDEIHKHIPQKVFLARWYPAETDDNYSQSINRIKALKEVISELGLELTDLGTRDTGSFDIRQVMYQNIKECDIFIADLSGARHNVMIEVGYALKHIDTGRMIFYFQETEKCKDVPFDVSHFAYDKINDSRDIKEKVKLRIQTILEQAKNGEI